MPFMNVGPGRIEYERVAGDNRDAATFVMLHEGLGSVSMWKDFPVQLARATGNHVVVYSRHGYGRSAAVRAPRTVRYMHDEALVVLPRFLDEIGIEHPILLGHSDGGSIALIHAGGSGRAVGGIVALAPHVMVEDISVSSIAAAKIAYQSTNVRERLARYHDDVDGAFWGWNDMWLDPAFRTWNIEEYLPRIRCRVLAIQGEDDEYGSMEQIERIARAAPEVEMQKFANCGHSPHRDQPEAVLAAVAQWTERYRARESAARHASAATRDPA
jgi:pimeloyl-ACP methyl ester carboxylesterase